MSGVAEKRSRARDRQAEEEAAPSASRGSKAERRAAADDEEDTEMVDSDGKKPETNEAIAALNFKKRRLMQGQTDAQRQAIRSEYRQIEAAIKERKDDLTDSRSGELNDMVRDVNVIYQKVLYTSEALPDARVMTLLTEYGVEQARKLQSLPKHSVKEVMAKAKIKYEEQNQFDWTSFGNQASAYIRTVPATAFMNGPIAVEAKERKVAQREKRSTVGEKERPDELTQANQEERTQTDRRVEALYDSLGDVGTEIPYYIFVTNPESFTQTVENMFDLSFMVKRCLARIIIRDNIPYVRKIKPPNPEELARPENAVAAMISKLNYRTYLQVIKQYKITKPFVPTRSVENVA